MLHFDDWFRGSLEVSVSFTWTLRYLGEKVKSELVMNL